MYRQFLAGMLSVALGVGSSLSQPIAVQHVRVVSAAADVLAEPSTQSRLLGQLKRGDILGVLYVSGDWYLLNIPGKQPGYVHKHHLEEIKVEPVATPQPTPEAEPVVAPEPSPEVAAATAPSPDIDHTPLECVRAETFPLVEADVTAQDALQRTRVYFKAHQYPDWYYVEMMEQAAPQFMALLPQPLPETKRLDYYVHALDMGLRTTRTDQYEPEVSRKDCRVTRALPPEQSLPREITVGGTKADQPQVPPGFSAKGIVAFVTAAGITMAGAQLLAGAGTASGAGGAGVAAGAAGAGKGLSATTIALLAGGVVATGAGTYALARPKPTPDPLTVDNDGDGFSENQGDCDDTNKSVNPNGAVTAKVEHTLAGMTVSCPGPAYSYKYSMTNNSCTTVTVQSGFNTTQYLGGTNCRTQPSTTEEIYTRTGTVPPGQTTVLDENDLPPGTWPCCYGGCGSRIFTCKFAHTFVFHTSAGDIHADGYEVTGIFGPACRDCRSSVP